MTDRIEEWHKRLEKARAIVEAGGVHADGPGRFIVVSHDGVEHTVFRGLCDCPDSRLRPWLLGYCKHRLAVELYLARLHEQLQAEKGEQDAKKVPTAAGV